MKSTYPLLIIAILSLFVSPSCSKKSSSPAQTCQIITLTDQLGTTTNQVFTYIGNTEIMSTSNGTSESEDSISLNSDGLIASDYYSNSSGGSSVTIYTYSGTELQKAVLTSGGNPPQTT